jgi:putative membrane protein
MMIIMAIFWLLVLALVIWLVYRLVGGGRGPGAPGGEDRAERILRERFARGEIDRETFERMLGDLRRGGGE